MEDVKVKVIHWKYVPENDFLVQYSSPYHTVLTCTEPLINDLNSNKKFIGETSLKFTREQIICGNESYPESAISDPIADIEVWNEWKTGIRVFPYEGMYKPFNINNQEPKTASTTTIGVLGEIISGFVAEALINSEILVRNIHRWPDFILLDENKQFVFFEAKATFQKPDNNADYQIFHVPTLRDFLRDAFAQINADPRIRVLGGFAKLISVKPEFIVEFEIVEVNAPDARIDGYISAGIPEAVAENITSRIINEVIEEASLKIEKEIQYGLIGNNANEKNKRFKEIVRNISKSRIKDFKLKLGLNITDNKAFEQISASINNMVQSEVNFNSLMSKRRNVNLFNTITEPIDSIVFNGLKYNFIRSVGTSKLYTTFHSDSKSKSDASWNRLIENSTKPYLSQEGYKVWKCGGALYLLK